MINSDLPTKKSCAVSDCTRPIRCRGWCSMHYQRWKAHGDPLVTKQGQRPIRDLWERFMSHVQVQPNGCWLWTSTISRGYGKFVITLDVGKQKIVPAHVWGWEQKNGPRPTYPQGHHLAGAFMPLDHYWCDNSACVNPDHLRPVTARENTLRSNGPAAQNAAKTECPKGHPYAPGERICRRCRNQQRMEYRKRTGQ